MYGSRAASCAKAASSTPPCCSMLWRARARNWSRLQPDRATPMIGMSSWPRRISAWSAGKICLYARSPVAPKNTNASDCGAGMLALPSVWRLACGPPSAERLFACMLLQVAAELVAHRREQLVGVVGLAARAEALVQRGAQHRGGHGLV